MSIPDLELTARLVGLPVPELWTRYLAVGGSSPQDAFAARLGGERSWPPQEDLFLAVALNDALIEESLLMLQPLRDLEQDGAADAGQPGGVLESGGAEVSCPTPSLPPLEGAFDREALRARSQDARALAHRLHRAAAKARQRAVASARPTQAGQPRRAAAALGHQRQRTDARRLADLLQAGAQVLWQTDAQGRVQQDSPTWLAFTGRSMVQRAGHGWLDAVHPADRRHAGSNWRSCVERDVPVRTHFRLWSVAAGRWQLTRVRAVPVHDPPGRTTGWVGTNTVVGDVARPTT